jgi:murein DD-endopeptidase MepM/ murein hydrolase activator NlpD
MKRYLAIPALALAFAAPAAQADSSGRPDSDVAALQVALRAVSLYSGSVDGVLGPGTVDALVEFQARNGLTPDGIAGPRTRRALGRLGAPELGLRRLVRGTVGWDVAELQFLLARHGFPSGTFDGVFGGRLEAAVRRFQRFRGLPQIGEAGPQTRAAVRSGRFPVSPIQLVDPVQAPIGDGYGPRGNAFHAGADFVAPAGTPVGAAGSGIVTWAAPRGSFGNAVMIAHRSGVRSLYGHLSRIDVWVGQRVSAGTTIGLVGSTGRSTGPHLHFEVRLRGATVDPLTALR